jgi:tripartite-type tricarboxylate transporter receptor subunit TctC
VLDTQWRGYVVKAGTDPQIVSQLETLLLEASEDPRYKAFAEERGEDVEILRSAEFDARLREEVATFKQLRTELGL